MAVDMHVHMHVCLGLCVCRPICVCIRTHALKQGSLSLAAGCVGGQFSGYGWLCPFQSWGWGVYVWLWGCLAPCSGAGSAPSHGPLYLLLPLPESRAWP